MSHHHKQNVNMYGGHVFLRREAVRAMADTQECCDKLARECGQTGQAFEPSSRRSETDSGEAPDDGESRNQDSPHRGHDLRLHGPRGHLPRHGPSGFRLFRRTTVALLRRREHGATIGGGRSNANEPKRRRPDAVPRRRPSDGESSRALTAPRGARVPDMRQARRREGPRRRQRKPPDRRHSLR